MADLKVQDRLQPSLLDRLRDDDPWSTREGREQRSLTSSQLRQAVLRDLGWLFNSKRGMNPDVEGLGHTSKSVLNFGIRDLSGMSVDSLELGEIEDRFYRAIIAYEPRILPHTVRVRAVRGKAYSETGAIFIEIQGELWTQHVPEILYLKTSLDLETGKVSIMERGT